MLNKYYSKYNYGSIPKSDISEYLTTKETDKDLEFVVLFDAKNSSSSNFMDLIDFLVENGINTSNLTLSIKNSNFNQNDVIKFRELEKVCNEKNVKFGIEDDYKTWKIDEVENANSKIDTIIEKVKGENLTELEIVFNTFLEITNREYIKENENQHIADSRSVYGVLNSNNIVCVGYCELFEAVIKKLNLSNVKIFQNSMAVETVNGVKAHRNLIIYIKDEKYGLDGYYMMDPTLASNFRFDKNNLATSFKKFMCSFLVSIDGIKKFLKTSKNIDYVNDTTATDFELNNIKVYNDKSTAKAVSFSNDSREDKDIDYTNEFLIYLCSTNKKFQTTIIKSHFDKLIDNNKLYLEQLKNKQNKTRIT